MDLMRDADVPPSMLRPGVGDHAAASNLVVGLLAAVRERDRTGRGTYVDVSLRNTALHILGADAANALVTGECPKRHDRTAPTNALWNTYPVADDDRWLMLCMIEPDRYWEACCRAIGREDLLAVSPPFDTPLDGTPVESRFLCDLRHPENALAKPFTDQHLLERIEDALAVEAPTGSFAVSQV